MNASGECDQEVEAVLQACIAGGIAPPPADAILDDPVSRLRLYKALVDRDTAPFRRLLLPALAREVAFRQALFAGACEDPDDHYEGIYRCAFLLYRAGEVADTLILWEAKHTNMDVGSSLGVEYFLGAGVAATRAFFGGWNEPAAIAILEYIDESLSYSGGEWDWREAWEREQAEHIRAA